MAHVDPSEAPAQPEPTDLLEAVNALSGHVVSLTEKLDVSAKVASRARFASYLAVLAVTLIAVVGSLGWLQLHTAVDQNRQNGIQACENANDSRSANLALWQFVLRLSARSNPDPGEEDAANLKALNQWIAKLYAPHDCSDLGRVYPIPPPPVFPTE